MNREGTSEVSFAPRFDAGAGWNRSDRWHQGHQPGLKFSAEGRVSTHVTAFFTSAFVSNDDNRQSSCNVPQRTHQQWYKR